MVGAIKAIATSALFLRLLFTMMSVVRMLSQFLLSQFSVALIRPAQNRLR